MSNDYTDPVGESEMRRRAAWLLAMLALVAVLLVALMVLFLGGGGSGNNGNNQAFPSLYPTAPTRTKPATHSSSAPAHHRRKHHQASHTSAAGSSSSVSVPPHSTRHTVNCPGSSPCVAEGDIGNAVAAINAYRHEHGQPPVSGSVTSAAQQCAVSNGGDCSGSWAESQVPAANGQEAVQKIIPFAHGLLDPSLSSLQVGWAYDPSAKQFYFALIEGG
ncbi:MAG TPA: hypothetical protein VFH38_11580 [Jatrophihabitans sp.]|nr:hypothetical protein [Jatrophihabitans sp.]